MQVKRIVEWSPDKQSWLVGYTVLHNESLDYGRRIFACSYVDRKPNGTWGGWPFLLKELVAKIEVEEVKHTDLPKHLARGEGG